MEPDQLVSNLRKAAGSSAQDRIAERRMRPDQWVSQHGKALVSWVVLHPPPQRLLGELGNKIAASALQFGHPLRDLRFRSRPDRHVQ